MSVNMSTTFDSIFCGVSTRTVMTEIFKHPARVPQRGDEISDSSRNRQHAIEIGEKSTMGRGGMASKINAASVAAAGGVHTVVASGFDVTNVTRVFGGEDVGTLFPASARPNKRQRWLTFATETKGKLHVSDPVTNARNSARSSRAPALI